MSPVSEIEEAMGLSPRRFSLWNRWTYLRVPPPDWLRQKSADELKTYFRWLPRTFRYGKVVMGSVIQANQYAWESETFDVPGEVVYSLTDAERVKDDDLLEVAKRLFRLKGTSPKKKTIPRRSRITSRTNVSECSDFRCHGKSILDIVFRFQRSCSFANTCLSKESVLKSFL